MRRAISMGRWELALVMLFASLVLAGVACDKGGEGETESGESGEVEFETVDADIGDLALSLELPAHYELERLLREGEPEASAILKWAGRSGEPEVRVGISGQNPVARDAPTTLAEAVTHVQRGPVGEREIVEQTETDAGFAVVGTDGTWTHLSIWRRGDPTLRCWVEYRSPDQDDPRLEFGKRVCGSLQTR